MKENNNKTLWGRAPVIIRAIIVGILVGMIAANIWPVFLATLRMPAGAAAEVAFLAVYAWWAAGGGPPARFKLQRAENFRVGGHSRSAHRTDYFRRRVLVTKGIVNGLVGE
jgi:hypothetical protein